MPSLSDKAKPLNNLCIKNVGEICKDDLERLVHLFFESSVRKTFSGLEEKKLFQFKYFDYYREKYPEYFFVLYDNGPIGYVCAIPRIFDAYDILKLCPYVKNFEKEWGSYSAHLHINMTSSSRGKGYGRMLMKACEEALRAKGGRGVHVITGADSRNRSFYEKNGFSYSLRERFQGIEYLFLAKSLH